MYALWDDDNNKLAAGPQDVGIDGWLPVVDDVGDYNPTTHAKKLVKNGSQIEYVLEAITPDWAGINRGKRNKLLKDSDWTQVDDAPLEKACCATYRQALRNMLNHVNWPNLSDSDSPVTPEG